MLNGRIRGREQKGNGSSFTELRLKKKTRISANRIKCVRENIGIRNLGIKIFRQIKICTSDMYCFWLPFNRSEKAIGRAPP
jgi:hypothetical protein